MGVIQPHAPEDLLISVSPDAIKHQVQLRLDALRQKTYEELLALPEWTSEAIPFGDLEAEVITYRQGTDGSDLTVVVQCFPPGSRRGVLWIGVYANGFHVTQAGAIRDLMDRERYEFM